MLSRGLNLREQVVADCIISLALRKWSIETVIFELRDYLRDKFRLKNRVFLLDRDQSATLTLFLSLAK